MRIELNDVTKSIGGQMILNHITLSMTSGKVYGFQGINGSGKTMLMRAIIGLIHLNEGDVRIDGKKLGKDIEFPESVGFLLENPTFLDRYSGKDNLKLLADIRGKAEESRINEVLRIVGLDVQEKKKYKKYSLGMKQRLGIAAAILEMPDLIILDEPANALDMSGVEMLKKIIQMERERGALVILSCHDAVLLQEMSDVIFEIEQGKILSVKEKKMEAGKYAFWWTLRSGDWEISSFWQISRIIKYPWSWEFLKIFLPEPERYRQSFRKYVPETGCA